MSSRSKNNYAWVTMIVLIFVALIVLFFYLDRNDQLSIIIRAWGLGGILFAILLMAALCMTPIPSEGLLFLMFKVFGIYQGIVYAWLGSLISSVVIFYLARYWGQSFFRNMITHERFEIVDHWIHGKGAIGLLIARLLPIPAFAVNYIAGVMPSVRFWPYMWTAGLAIIPYYLGTMLDYLGVAKSTWLWLAVGGCIIIVLWAISYRLMKEE
jgi:uncharacterized membrane protein YdjX (TVP38/TMEM64 family)